MAAESVLSLHAGAAHRLVGGEYFIVTDDRSFHHVHVPTAVTLFGRLVSGPQTIGDLVDTLLQQFDVERSEAERDVQAFATTLVERRLAFQPTGVLGSAGGD